MVKNTWCEKVRKMSNDQETDYVNAAERNLPSGLWKTGVEKSVENVEKFWFSTGKPALSHFRAFGKRSFFPQEAHFSPGKKRVTLPHPGDNIPDKKGEIVDG